LQGLVALGVCPGLQPLLGPGTVVFVNDQVALLVLVIGEGNFVAGADAGAGLIVAGREDAVGVGGALRQADGVGPVVGFVGDPLAAQVVALAVAAGDDPLGLVEFPPFLGPVEGHLFTVFGVVVAVADEDDGVLSRKDGHCDPSVFIQNNGLFYKSVPNPVHDEGAQGDPATRTRMQMKKMRPFLFFTAVFLLLSV